jgi:endonuclease YncB( thermonuclease family)/Leucine-rich repeat (LRR) protein
MAALVPQPRSTLRADDPPSVQSEAPRVVKEKIAGACRFPAEDYLRITGKVKVLDSHTLAFDDGTQVELNGGMDGPELEQWALIGDVLYPCGREAAEFLKRLIGDQPVVCYLENDRGAKPRGDAYVGESRLDVEMVRGGWAISHHSGTESWEIIARQNKRGLWRGVFVEPEKWRKGERLPGEPGTSDSPQRLALAALSGADPLVKLDLTRPGRPVVALHFRPNYGPMRDEDLAHLAAFPRLKSVELPNKSRITDAGLAHLAALRELEEIDLNGTKVTPAAVVRLIQSRTGLKRLGLTGIPFRDNDLAELSNLVNLEELSLRGSLVTDEGLAHLAPFGRLKSLSLMSTAVTDAGLAHLKHLAKLEDLDLHRTAITDAGLAQLATLRKLRRLQVAETAVTDAGLAQLEPLPDLRSLNLRRTKVTPAGLAKLKRALPQLDTGRGRPDSSSAIVGVWESIDHHAAMGSLYQPVHGARHRESQVHFEQTIDGLAGRAVHADHAAITHQERWRDGRTEFKNVEFADGQLKFEFDIGQRRQGSGPLAVERGRLENKGTVRVEARLQGDQLIGKWSMFTADGAEVFRGEWQATRAGSQEQTPGAIEKSPPAAEPTVMRDHVRGSIHHGRGMRDAWQRIAGKVRVLDATTVEFADGTRIALDMAVPRPDQMALQGDVLYPAGKEAAEFLRRFIDDRPIMCIQNGRGDGPWTAYVGDVNIERAMVVNGWALADHSSLHGDEIIARENRRGQWRGRFVLPEEWSAGVRLPGEPPPGNLADEREAARLLGLAGRNDAALAALIPRIVADLPTVRRLNFQNTNLTDDQAAQICRLTALEDLRLGGPTTDACLVHLRGLPHLKRLELTSKITDAGLAQLAESTGLKHLDLGGAPITDDGLKHLAGLTAVEVLHLGYAHITDAGLSHLVRMHQLRHLTLYNTRIGNEGLKHLRGLTSLAVLDIHQTRVTDAGAPHLAELANLAFLDIGGNGITEAGVLKLTSLKKLRVLKVSETLSQAARDRLVEAIPGLQFEGRPEEAEPSR